MEYYLNDHYDVYKNVYFDIELSWDKNDIRVDVYVDEYEWNDLGSYYQELYLEDLYREISYDFSDEDLIQLYKNAKVFVEKEGRAPSKESTNEEEVRMAYALAKLSDMRARRNNQNGY